MKKAFCRWKKPLLSAAIVAAYSLLNYCIRLRLPGISSVDVRPQIVLIFLAGYLCGPFWGFVAGFLGNLCTDLLFGYGLAYLGSWTTGNGLLGALMGFFPYRKQAQLERISQLGSLAVALVLINGLSLAYAASMESIGGSQLASTINFRYFYLPALLANVLVTLVLFPAILLALGRLKKNFPLKIALATYYLTIVLMASSWVIFFCNLPAEPANYELIGHELLRGNALVDSFNYWVLLMVALLIVSFLFSGWLSKMVVTPLKELEDTVYAVLHGDPSSQQRLAAASSRQDEMGILSYTIQLLSEKLWETQKLFRDETKKTMSFLDQSDSGTDTFLIALIALFGREALENPEADKQFTGGGEISNMAAISLMVAVGGLRELADTYSAAKISKSIEGLGSGILDAISSLEEQQALALVVDLDLVFKGRLKVMDLQAMLDADFAFHLLEKMQAFQRKEEKFIGYVTEHDIISKVQHKWENAQVKSNDELEPSMKRAVAQRVITGYQMKNREDLSQFDPDLKIMYSHSNFKHVKQLLGLLASENLQAKIQLEPKRSSFLYLDAWERTPELQLETLAEGWSIAHKDEVDVVLEFSAPEQRDRFRTIIEAFAKRASGDAQKLIYDSWYQPLYCSEVPVEGYNKIAKLALGDQKQLIHVYCTEQKTAKLISFLQKETGAQDLAVAALWVNDAFLRYLQGTTSE
jgi:uncharacterized membrane protein